MGVSVGGGGGGGGGVPEGEREHSSNEEALGELAGLLRGGLPTFYNKNQIHIHTVYDYHNAY